jgi:DNA-binding beta-propeller fold protein YncE
VSTLAGNGLPGRIDAHLAWEGRLNSPDGPSVAPDGTIYFVDQGNNAVRFVSRLGQLGTLAGGASVGYLDAIGSNALFSHPLGTAARKAGGELLVADAENDVIRRIILASGQVSTFAGDGARGFRNGPGIQARFAFPNDLVELPDRRIAITEFQNHTVRLISTDGIVSTLAGGGVPGFADQPGALALFHHPAGLAVDSSGNLYITEWEGHRVRKITPNGEVSTVAGTGIAGYQNGRALEARFHNPNGIAVGPAGELYVCDSGNHVIRRIAGGVVTTYAGWPSAGFADGTEQTALFNVPSGVAITANGSAVITDLANHRLRLIEPGHQTINPPSLRIEPRASILPGDRQAFELQVSGTPSSMIVIQTSSQLPLWSSLAQARLNGEGKASFIGQVETGARFFRAVQIADR